MEEQMKSQAYWDAHAEGWAAQEAGQKESDVPAELAGELRAAWLEGWGDAYHHNW